MILSSLAVWEQDKPFEHAVIAEAVEELQHLLSTSPTPGRYDLRGDKMYVNVMELDAKSLDEQIAEKHESYIDLQYLIEGEETIGWSPLHEDQEPFQPYDREGDYALYMPQRDEVLLQLKAGMFAVFFPHDIHRPGMGMKSARIRKAVIKIHTDLFI